MSEIQKFYAGQKVFITGGTGFLGRILIEKLLRSCPDIETIYLLIRAKKGKSAEERIDALLVDSVFDVLREECPDFSKKVIGITGDVAEEGLGLSITDRALLVNEVSVIFHLAATVRFNEKLEKAVAINVDGTKAIVEIAEACKNLKVGVYVSTAYSHCIRESIEEQMYPPPLSYEGVNKLVQDAAGNEWSEDEIKNFTEKVTGQWPNTYAFTKAIAEGVIAEYAKDLPFAVFRPSIVVNAYREPIPGWVYGILGFPGIVCAAGLGIMHVLLVDERITLDIVPVDYVCNALIACSWETAITKRRPNGEIPVYNYISGKENPVVWLDLDDRVKAVGRNIPSNSTITYPWVIFTTSERVLAVLELFFHLIPAFIVDSIRRLWGKPPMMYKLACKLAEATRIVGYFLLRQWNFENQRTQDLWNRIGLIDRQMFPFSMRKVDWDEHTLKMIKGLRKYIVGDSDDNIKQARRRIVHLRIIHLTVTSVFIFFFLWIVWKLFTILSPIIGVV